VTRKRSPTAGRGSSRCLSRVRRRRASRSASIRGRSASRMATATPRRASSATRSPSRIAGGCSTWHGLAGCRRPTAPSPSPARGSASFDVTTLDEVRERLERLHEAGDEQGRGDVVAGARVQFRDALELREWDAALAVDQERFEDALAILDRVLAADPRRAWARRERASVLLDLGRLEEALAALRELPREPDPNERASVHHDVGLCLDHLGHADEAAAEFRRAACFAPDTFPVPLRLSDERFEALVAEALDDVPDEFTRLLGQVVVRVRDYPAHADGEPFLLGLYVGVARPERSLATEDHLDHVLIFKRPHELRCTDETALRDARGHHFGIPHDDMGEYE